MKTLLLLAVSLPLGGLSFGQEKGIINNQGSPHARLKSVDIDDCRWTEGFWADKFELCHEVMIPNLGRLMDDPEIIHGYENFLVAAGIKEGEFRGWSFHDGDFYKYVEAMCYAYAMTGDEKIDQRMDEIIGVIAKAQTAEGYLHTQNQIGHGVKGFRSDSERKFEKKSGPFEAGGGHEFYNFGHMMTAACIHHRVTGKRNFLEIAIKAADLICREFGELTPELASVDWNPPHYMGLVELYRTTGEERYLRMAESFINMRGKGKVRSESHTGPDHSQKRTPIRDETEAVGHAGHGNYLYAGVADLYAETGDQELLESLERIWTNMTTRKMYVTGATGSHHFGISKNRDKVNEAYGDNFELPNVDTYNETCANIGNAMWSWRMFLLGGDARYADITELAFYNSSLSGIGLEGKLFYYTNPLRFIQGHPHMTKDEGRRSPFISVFCCPPNIIRTIASMNSYAYTTSREGVWVNLYGGNVLDTDLADGSKVKLSQVTDYPWDGLVKIKVEVPEPKEFSMMLRIPGWATGAEIKVNGEPDSGTVKPGSYFELRREWSTGDEIGLELPMEPQLVQANPSVESTRSQVAVKRGPLVYCLEGVDLPKGVDLSRVVIPRNAEFSTVAGEGALAGLTMLEGRAKLLPEQDWSSALYQAMPRNEPEEIDIRLVPYFAWSNREISDMSVWLPLAY